jgi:hypothetical protein
MLMFIIVVTGLMLTAVAQEWRIMVKRELEADLLAKGIEIQNALALYSATMKAGRNIPGEIYPAALIDLTKPPKPALRKVYLDPIGHGDWELVRHPKGGIMGVRSRSKDKPIKKREFPLAVRHFENLPTYHDWVFQFPNTSTASAVPLGGPQLGAPAATGQFFSAQSQPVGTFGVPEQGASPPAPPSVAPAP